MARAFDSIKKGLQEAIAHQKGKAHGVKTYTLSESKRNIGKEIIEGFETLKAWRQGKVKLKTHRVEKPKAKDVPARNTVRATNHKIPKRAAKKAAVPSASHEAWVVNRLKTPKMAAAYLEAAIEDGDQGALTKALRRIVQAQGGVAEIARRSHLTHEATYRMLSKGGNPELRSFTALLAGAGLRLSIKPVEIR